MTIIVTLDEENWGKRPGGLNRPIDTASMQSDSYELVNIHYGCWERTNARSGGLQEWAMHEICAEDFCVATVRNVDMCLMASLPAVVTPRQAMVRHVEMCPMASLPAVVTPRQSVIKPKAGPTRQRLAHEEAVAIYLAKLGPKSSKTAARLAAEFGITAKAVRDVWRRQTWADQTRCVWTVQIAKDYVPPSPSSAVAAARVERALSRVQALKSRP